MSNMREESTPVLEERPDEPQQASNNRGNFTRNLSTEADSAIAKKMFLGGMALLPWLHLVNVIFFRKQFLDPSLDAGVTLWVRRSFMGFVFTTILFISWVLIFQLNWEDFGWAKLVMVLPSKNLDVGW